jgi:hypothetical protein
MSVIQEAEIFASHFVDSSCMPRMVICPQGITVTGARINERFLPLQHDSPQQTVMYIRFEPNLGEIWIRHGNNLDFHACTMTYVRAWVQSGMMHAEGKRTVHTTVTNTPNPDFELRQGETHPNTYGRHKLYA